MAENTELKDSNTEPQNPELAINDSEFVMEGKDADCNPAVSSPVESQLEDIDIEQCDFISEESKVSPEDELIELLRAASVRTSPEDRKESFGGVDVDEIKDINMEKEGLVEEEEELPVVLHSTVANEDWKSKDESDSSDDVIERFEASLSLEEQGNFNNPVFRSYSQNKNEEEVNLRHESFDSEEGKEEDVRIEDDGTAEENAELEGNLLNDTSANQIDELVKRLGEIENELSDSEVEGATSLETTTKSSDQEFEETERLMYEEKARIAAEEKTKQLGESALSDSSDEEFKQLEKVLYEQKAHTERKSKRDDSNDEFARTASDEEFEQLEKMAYDERTRSQFEAENVLGEQDEKLASKDTVKENAKPLSPSNLPISSKNAEEDDLLDIIGSSDSEDTLSSEETEENLAEVGKLILAQAREQSSDDRETLGSDDEKPSDRNVTWTLLTRTSAPAPPISAPVASEHNVAFVSLIHHPFLLLLKLTIVKYLIFYVTRTSIFLTERFISRSIVEEL